MVVKDGQPVAASLVACAEVAFEIHLPQVVGKQMPEALPRSRGTAGFDADAAVAAQDAVDRTRREDDAVLAREDLGDLARAQAGWSSRTARIRASCAAERAWGDGNARPYRRG